MMKIMFIAPGRSIHSNNWASAMCDRGHEVHFVTQESFTENTYSFSEKVDDRIIVHELPVKGKIGFLLNGLSVKKIEKEINPDVIHVHQAAGYGFLGTFSNKKKAFISIYGWEVYDLIKKTFWKNMVHYVLKWYKYIGSTSVCMKDQVYKVFPDIHTKIYVTPFGVDMKHFKAEKLEKKEIVVGTVKKMDKKYGIEYLIRAFSILYKRLCVSHPEKAEHLYLELVGPGNQIGELKEIVNELELSDRVRFVGKVMHSDVVNQLNRFDIYSAPSILDSESFGVAVIEASSCRKPVVVSNVGGLPEVVVDGKTGYLVPPKNPDALAHRIEELIIDDEKRIAFGIAGEAFVREKYEWSKCVDIMENIYTFIAKENV